MSHTLETALSVMGLITLTWSGSWLLIGTVKGIFEPDIKVTLTYRGLLAVLFFLASTVSAIIMIVRGF